MYDPLKSQRLDSNQPSSDAYWLTTDTLLSFPTLRGDINADVLIVGGGYTGLSCAIHLAKSGVQNIVVLEANHIGWGCSGRNAGFVLPGSGRLAYSQLEQRFGMAATQRLHSDYMEAIELVGSLAQEAGDDIAPTEHGYLKLAHSKKWFDKLKSSADYLHKHFDYDVDVITKTAFQQDYVDHKKVHGAIRYKNGYGLNPLKLVNAFARLAQKLGVKIFAQSAVTEITHGKPHRAATQNGSVTAYKLVMATNGYTPQGMRTELQGKILPVLTSVIVTEPLTEQQKAAANFRTQQVMMDTRELKYYYRLLNDGRILFGGRGAISGAQAQNPKFPQRLLAELHSSFPALREIKTQFNWIGWISVSIDQMPHIYGTREDVYYSTGYCGSGVSFTSLAGKQLADLVMDKQVSSPLVTQLPKFPFAPFRRMGQSLYYEWGRFKDWIG